MVPGLDPVGGRQGKRFASKRFANKEASRGGRPPVGCQRLGFFTGKDFTGKDFQGLKVFRVFFGERLLDKQNQDGEPVETLYQ